MHGEESSGIRLIGHSDLAGHGDGMQVMRHEDVLFVGHFGPSGMGTSILDISDPADPTLVRQIQAPAGAHTHKVQIAEDLLLVNHEAFRGGRPDRVGLAIHDISDPYEPKEIGFWDSTGLGVHRIVWEGGRYAYASATPDGFRERIWVVVDVEDPSHPVERARWWWPGMADGETRSWPDSERRSVHHALIDGNHAYLGFWDGGMVILDISDLDAISVLSRIGWQVGGHTHTCLPLPSARAVAVTDEATFDDCQGPPHMIRIIDVSDGADPRVRSVCPTPGEEFCRRGLRYGAHCLHENRPGSYQSERLIFATYFNAGLRVYDVGDIDEPFEVGHYIPECPPGQRAIQINDVFVDESMLIHVTDRIGGGVYILEPDERLIAEMRESSNLTEQEDR